jgi:UDP-N-acetylmuramate: L-alanyl-gamma-D-glutamyl-meso-diaminopimelate ligase
VLTAAGLDPSMLVGGIAANFGDHGSSYRLGQGREFVIEGDEYDSAFFDKTAKFLKYLPDIAVVTNVEFDHADIYGDLDEIRLAFRRFVNLVPRRGLLLLGADNPDALALKAYARSPVETFGFSETADWQAREAVTTEAGTTFRVSRHQVPFGLFEVPLLGDHNVRNALVALAVSSALGVSAKAIADALRQFKGIRRRLEAVGVSRGVTVYDDFAHHPTAVAATLAGLRAAHPGSRIRAVFEPRSASSCRRVFQRDFARAFERADDVIVAAVYRSGLPDSERLSPDELVRDLNAAGHPARYIPDVDDIVATLVRERREGDLIVIMSNGEFGGIHEKLLAALGD